MPSGPVTLFTQVQAPPSAAMTSRKKSPKVPSSLRKFKPGHVINGRYRIERLIARGGMGCVYLGYQIPLERKVAIKILIPQTHDIEFRKRFFLEASINARLTHRHIVIVHDYGETEEKDLFMVMEYLEGEPLSKVINRDTHILPGRACLIAIQVARALRAAHRVGVVHRDLKPSNVMVLRDEDEEFSDLIKVMDFGLVKIFGDTEFDRPDDESGELTRSGVMLGSPRYMSPEQIRSEDIDPRTDIYSLGVLMFHMIAGRPPFVGQGSVEILTNHLKMPPPPMAAVGHPDCPMELEIILQRCLAKKKSDRYPSMEELLSDLKTATRMQRPRLHSSSTLGDYIVGSSAMASSVVGLTNIGSQHQTPRNASLADVLSGSFVSNDDNLNEELMLMGSEPQKHFPWRLLLGVTFICLIFLLLNFTLFSQNFSLPEISLKKIQTLKLLLTSEPSGADVWLDNDHLGKTPIIVEEYQKPPENKLSQFTFKYEGHRDTLITKRLDSDVSIHAQIPKLAPVPNTMTPTPETTQSNAPQFTSEAEEHRPLETPSPTKPIERSQHHISPLKKKAEAKQTSKSLTRPKKKIQTTKTDKSSARPKKRNLIVEQKKSIVPVVD